MQRSTVRELFGMRRKISHESHYFHLGLKEYIKQMHLSTSKWRNSPWSLVRFEFFLLPQFKWRKNSTRSGKCMRAVCISPRATSMWSRSHMPGICYIPAKTGLSKSVHNSIQLTNSEAEHCVWQWNIHHLKKWHLLWNTDWQLKLVYSMHEYFPKGLT